MHVGMQIAAVCRTTDAKTLTNQTLQLHSTDCDNYGVSNFLSQVLILFDVKCFNQQFPNHITVRFGVCLMESQTVLSKYKQWVFMVNDVGVTEERRRKYSYRIYSTTDPNIR